MQEDFMGNLGMGLVTAAAYGLLGIILTLVAYRLLFKVAGFDLKKELVDDQNVCAGMIVSALILAIAYIMGSAIT